MLGRLPQASQDLVQGYDDQNNQGRISVDQKDGRDRETLVVVIERALRASHIELSVGKKSAFMQVCKTCFVAAGFRAGPESTIRGVIHRRKVMPETNLSIADGGNIAAAVKAISPPR